MDYQVLFNGAVAIASFFGGWTLNSITKAIERLDSDVRAMPHDYVSKTDYKDELREVKDMLGKIFDKLENKADK
jgi:membrane-anchored protein YejM (alkaline phosphatase superfamily)